jgi:Starch binding domain/GDSL-like Lipase/Acylhydrolase family/Putative papain-like cysteine peptidase (DUF1796)
MYRFQIIAHTQPGESVGIIGSAAQMGAWDITQCLRLRTSPDAYPLWWSADIEIDCPPDQHPEYKYVYIRADGSLEWEGFGLNRWLPIGPDQPKSKIVVDDGAFGYVQPYPFGYLEQPVAKTVQPNLSSAVGSGLKIAIIGSSVAQGHRAWMLNGWAQLLAQTLSQRYGHQVINCSELGANVHRTIARFPTVVTPEQPDIVIIALSLGNEGLAHCAVPDRPIVQRRFETGLQQLLTMTREIGAYPMLGGVYPHGDYQPEHATMLRETNQRMLTWGVPVLDWLARVDNGQGGWKAGTSFDPAHPNTIGHQYMYDAIALNSFAIDRSAIQLWQQQRETLLYDDESGFQLSMPQPHHLQISNPSPYSYTIAPYWQELQTVLGQKAQLMPGLYLAKTPQAGVLPYFDVQDNGTIATTWSIPAGTDLEYSAAFEYLAPNRPECLFYDGHLGIVRAGEDQLWIINESVHEFNIHPMWRAIAQALTALPAGVYHDPLDPDADFRTLMIGDRGLESRVKAPPRSAMRLQYQGPLSAVSRVAIVPLGARCAARMLLYKLGYDGPAYPFDLTRTTNLGDVADMVAHGFDDMWNPNFLHYNALEKRIYHGKWHGLSFAHEVEDDEDPSHDMQPIYRRMQSRYQSRSQRFWYTLAHADKLLFVRNGFCDRASVIDLMTKLTIKCAGKPFRLLVISPQLAQEYANLADVIHYNLDFNPDRMYADREHWMQQATVMRQILESLGVSSKNLFWCPPNPPQD